MSLIKSKLKTPTPPSTHPLPQTPPSTHPLNPPPQPTPCNKFLPVLLWNLFEEKREIRSIYCRTLTAFIDCILPE